MHIKHDYSYITASSEKLAQHGFGKQTVFSLTLGRYFSEAERQEDCKFLHEGRMVGTLRCSFKVS